MQLFYPVVALIALPVNAFCSYLALAVPTTWMGICGLIAGIGTTLGLVIAYFASREYIKRTIDVLKQTIDSQEQILKTKEELALSLAETNKDATSKLEQKLEAMTNERDGYRKTSHDQRDRLQVLELENQEFKLRPDLNKVLDQEQQWHERREKFYLSMADSQSNILKTQQETIRTQQETVTLMRDLKDQMTHRDTQLTDLLRNILEQLRINAEQTVRELKTNAQATLDMLKTNAEATLQTLKETSDANIEAQQASRPVTATDPLPVKVEGKANGLEKK